VQHGPADLTVGVFVDRGREADWDWCKWLPHARSTNAGGAERWLSGDREQSDDMLRALAGGAGTGTVLAVLDSDVLTEGKNAPARDLLQAGAEARHGSRGLPGDAPVPVAGIVVATSADRLPASCNTVIEITSPYGDATVRRPEDGTVVPGVLLGRARARDGASVRARRRALRGSRVPPGRRRPARQRAPAVAA